MLSVSASARMGRTSSYALCATQQADALMTSLLCVRVRMYVRCFFICIYIFNYIIQLDARLNALAQRFSEAFIVAPLLSLRTAACIPQAKDSGKRVRASKLRKKLADI
jgi:hypothetical protein